MTADAELQALLDTLGTKPPKAPPYTKAFMTECRALVEKHGGEDPTRQAFLAYLHLTLLLRSVIRDDGIDPDAVNAAAKALEDIR